MALTHESCKRGLCPFCSLSYERLSPRTQTQNQEKKGYFSYSVIFKRC